MCMVEQYWYEYHNLFHPIHTAQFEHDLRVIRDCDVIVRDSIVIREFKRHLKFLANRVCFDHLRASLVVLGGFFKHVNKRLPQK